MSIADRLGQLRRQAGVVDAPQPAAEPPPSGTSLVERIARARPRERRVRRPDDRSLAALLGGRVLAPGVIEVVNRLPLGRRHGRASLAGLSEPMAELPGAVGDGDWLFLDTETSGLSGGTGTLAFLVGMARVDLDCLEVRQWLLTAFAGEAPMLAAAAEWGRQGTLVSYNGRSFDLPLLLTRLRLQGQPDPFAGRPHLDLLFPTRRAFATRWEDCRLATAERSLLGFTRPADVPGAEVPLVWFDWLHRGDTSRLADVLRHNLWDLVSLAALMPALAEAYAAPLAVGGDAAAVAQHWLDAGVPERAYSILRAAAATLDARGLSLLARLHRRRGEWAEAVSIWSRLADEGDPTALEHLAKYHEHVARDSETALRFARQLPEGERRARRLARLRTRSARGAGPPALRWDD
jgi:hypothetical protein